MTAELVVPESVRLYLTDAAVRSAIDALLDEDKSFAADLDREDLPNFYRATLAAHAFRADWGIFGLELCDATWGAALADFPSWRQLTTAEVVQAAWAVAPTLLIIGDNDPFQGWMAATRSEQMLWYGVMADVSGFKMIVSLNSPLSDPFKTFTDPDIALEMDQNGNWISTALLPPNNSRLGLEPLLELARRLLRLADDWASQKQA